jgi:WD40 repeat protein
MITLARGGLAVSALAAVVAMAFAKPPPPGWNAPVFAGAQFSKDNKYVLATFYQTSKSGRAGNLHQTLLHDAATGKPLAKTPSSWRAGGFAALTPDGTKVLLVGRPEDSQGPRECEWVLWDWRAEKPIRKFEIQASDVASYAFSPDGKLAFTGHWTNRITVWDVSSGKQVLDFDLPHHPNLHSSAHVPLFFISNDGKRAVTGFSNSIKVWDIATGKRLGPELADYEDAQKLSRHTVCACTPDGRYACTGLLFWDRNNPVVRVWDLEAGKLFRAISLPRPEYLAAAAITNDGSEVLAVDRTGELREHEG